MPKKRKVNIEKETPLEDTVVQEPMITIESIEDTINEEPIIEPTVIHTPPQAKAEPVPQPESTLESVPEEKPKTKGHGPLGEPVTKNNVYG